MKETRIYKELDEGSISADIYYVGSNSPIIIYIHGGALIFGTRTWLSEEQIDYYAQAGFSVVSIDYRLAPETKLDSIIEDIRDAVDWVKTKARVWYDFDTDHIAVMGGSAGGYLSLLVGTMDIKPQAIVSFYGYGDILGEWLAQPSEYYCRRPIINRNSASDYVGDGEITEGSWERFNFYLYCRQQGDWIYEVTGMDRINDREELLKYIPIEHVTAEYPPTLLLHGDHDTDVPYEQSVIMYEKLKEYGVTTKLVTIEGADHVFDQNFEDPMVQNAFQKVVDFLKIHLYK
ncbi:alpha/beta hydrolase [Paenibacillus segetis]|uniref:Alpha/beta hydrolase n=1 Tax=Paenibacillus segetis TaxID=1325360 RepID=A0ABQ1YJE5_9BACL|nr:alpha/beta hydrolase [Paenibacillus segetis]GGH26869.1 alpha/beta hydrolase [Paenibacillus segetis]